jgi:hypothetical protein
LGQDGQKRAGKKIQSRSPGVTVHVSGPSSAGTSATLSSFPIEDTSICNPPSSLSALRIIFVYSFPLCHLNQFPIGPAILRVSKPTDFNRNIYYKNKLEFSLETGWLPINIPWPFDFLVGDQ